MSENKKPPFEQAQENIQFFVESADMLQSISNLKQILKHADSLEEHEKQAVESIVETTLKTMSEFIGKRGHKWKSM